MEKIINQEELRALSYVYFEGKATHEQEARLFELVGQDKKGRAAFRELEAAWQDSHVRSDSESEAFAGILSKVGDAPEKTGCGRRSLRAALAFGIASFIVAVGLGTALVVSNSRESGYFTFSSTNGCSSAVTLADGTKVILNRNSRLGYGSDFTPRNRFATLEGDAFFDVTKDPEHPFTLMLGKCSLCVKGTKFSVSAPADGEKVEATLIEGAIDFIAGGETRKILPGESVRYHSSDGSFEIRHVDPDTYLAFMKGKVEYYNVTISELCGYLEDIYGNKIHLDPKLSASDVLVSMRLSSKEVFEDVISSLKLMVPMSIRYEGDNVWLTAK